MRNKQARSEGGHWYDKIGLNAFLEANEII